MVRVPSAPKYTAKQEQYFAFIYYYAKVHGHAPAAADGHDHFRSTPPAGIPKMILTLEWRGLTTRTPAVARSIRLTLPRTELPDLE